MWSSLLAHSAITFTSDHGEPQIGCFGKGVTSFCECKGIGGNPPSLASWLKDGERITGPEYLRSELRQEDVVGRKQGIYTCEVENGNLKVGKSVTLSKYKTGVYSSDPMTTRGYEKDQMIRGQLN